MIDLDEVFKYQAPTEEKKDIYIELRQATKNLATIFDLFIPDSQEKLVAFEKLREAVMWANAGVAMN